ncbi:7-deoxyloganetin glucosyltransferase [Ricinus communis]|uniref:7-deoxyloganetin glucosyltransferase n=1 Tax=Ricinus communis TaxID=3988 RepID=UPI00201B00F8|nr:7-deoxyloganetin glucosyltransferase [Ricinus communis]
MESLRKLHAICIPLPAQGHINPMLKLAKLLHFRGFYITFVHTEFNYKCILNSRGPDALKGCHDFRFETISDGLPEDNPRGIDDLARLCVTLPETGRSSFRDLIVKLNGSSDVPDVSCIVSDGVMSFTLHVAVEFGIPEMILFTPSACGILGYLHYEELKRRGYFPLKDENCLTNGYLDTRIDWIPAMKGVRLKDLPTFIRSTDPNDLFFNYNSQSMSNSMKAKGLILNTFDELEQEVLDAIKTKFPVLYTIGPLSMLHQHLSLANLESIESNLWQEDIECLNWLDKREPNSVVYVNYGSLITMTKEQLEEIAWGLANSKYSFLWVIRPNILDDGEKIISNEFMNQIKGRALLVSWCPQEKVLAHNSIGGFLTHCGWNSTIESISNGVPLICWPFFADQQTNCLYCCSKWGIGMEIDSDVKRGEIERIVKELMEGNKGKEMKVKAMEWKRKAEVAIMPGGSSYTNFERLVNDLVT